MSSNHKFKGIIVEESLSDNRIINDLKIIEVKITKVQNPMDRWHIYTVLVSKRDIFNIQSYLKQGAWYTHFWNDEHLIIVFPKKVFEFNVHNQNSWQPAIEYGLSLKIPLEQLDFFPIT